MEFIKKLRKVIIVTTLVTMIMMVVSPIVVLGASETNVPVVTPIKNGGEVKVGDYLEFAIKDDTKITFIFYAWDRRTQEEDYTTIKLAEEDKKAEYTFKIQVPELSKGIHEFSIAAQDYYGNISYWLNIPYIVVDELSGVEDNTKPTLIFDTKGGNYPYHNSTIPQEMPITLTAEDDSGIYYIAYKWTQVLQQNDTGATLAFNKNNITEKSFTTEIKAPETPGYWYLLVYARDGANNASGTYVTGVVVEERDYTALQDKLAEIKDTLVPGDYENGQELEDALTEAEKMISENKSRQKAIDEQLSKIEDIISKLQPKEIDRRDLDSYIDSLESTDYKNWADLESLIEEANNAKLQSEFDKKLDEIKEFELVAKEIDTTRLDEIKAELAELDSSDYTVESWTAVQDLIEKAESAELQSEFDAIVDEIEKKIEALAELPKVISVTEGPIYVNGEKEITISFEANMELNTFFTSVEINDESVLEIVKAEPNKYEVTYTIEQKDIDNGSISYAITPVNNELISGKEVTGKITILRKQDLTAEDFVVIPLTTTVYDGTRKEVEVKPADGIEGIGKIISIKYDGKVSAPTDAGEYSIRIYVAEGEKYNAVDNLKVGTLTITQATPEYEVPTGLTAVYGDTLDKVESQLTAEKGEFKFQGYELETTEVGPVGENKFLVTYTPADTTNYKTITDIEVIITVSPADYELGEITFDDETVTYDGKPHSIFIDEELPEEVTVEYEGNGKVNVGEYTVTAKFILADDIKDNYNTIKEMEATLKILKATPKTETLEELTAVYGQTLADVVDQLPKGYAFKDELTTSVGKVKEINKFEVTYTPDDTDNYEVIEEGLEVTIKVEKATYDMSGIEFKPLTVTYDGDIHTIEIEGELPEGVEVSYENNARRKVGKSTAIARFKVEDEDNYNLIPEMTAILTVEKATPEYEIPEGLTAIYGEKLSSVELGTGFTFQGYDLETTEVGPVGENKFLVTYTPADTTNYKTITDIEVIITVSPADYELVEITFDGETVTYDGKPHSIFIDGQLPDGVTVEYEGNGKVNVGEYTVTAKFILADDIKDNYNPIKEMKATLKIEPKSISADEIKAQIAISLLPDDERVSDGTPKAIRGIKVTLGEKELFKGKDYIATIDYSAKDGKDPYGPEAPIEAGRYIVRVYIQGIGNYTGNASNSTWYIITEPVVSSVTVVPTSTIKEVYKCNETLDFTGWIVEVTYNNGKLLPMSMEDAEEAGIVSINYDFRTSGKDKTITITCKDETLTYDVTVMDEVTGIQIDAQPTTIVYTKVDDTTKELDKIGLSVLLKKASGDEEITEYVKLSGYDLTKVGSQIVTVSYTDNNENSFTSGKTFTTTFGIAVVPEEESEQPNYVIIPNGELVEKIEVNSTYTEKGAKIYDLDSKIVEDNNITIGLSGDIVDPTTPGKYKIVYSVESENVKVTSVTRTVYVVDTTAPVITLVDGIKDIDGIEVIDSEEETVIKFERQKETLESDETFKLDEIVNVTDNYTKFEDIKLEYAVKYNGEEKTGINEITLGAEVGTYTVTYTATDAIANEQYKEECGGNNTSTKVVKFIVLDNPPIMYYLAENDKKVPITDGAVYNDYLKINCDKKDITMYIKDGDGKEKVYDGELLKDGIYLIRVVENEYVSSAEVRFTIDTIAPTVSLDSENRRIIFEDPSDVYRATLSDGSGELIYTIKDETVNYIDDTNIYNIPDDAIKYSKVYVLEAEDANGNKIIPIKFKLYN